MTAPTTPSVGPSARPSAPRFDLPTIDEGTAPWWAATRDNKLLVKRCADCGKAHFYPRPFCPYCWSENVAWEQASGRATLYTWSVVYSNDLPPFPDKVPYAAAIVDLDEGPRMMTRVVGAEFADLRVGMALEVTFEQETDDITLPVFRPA